MAGYIDVNAALTEAKDAVKNREGALRRVGIVRADLRHAVEQGTATAEQSAAIRGMFPPRTRKAKAGK
jgi:hypothetical protein